MKNTKTLLLLILTVMSTSISVFAQSDNGGAACAVFGVVYLLVMAVVLAVTIAIIVFIIKWIRKDAIAKGMPNADSIKWLGLLGLLGLIIYLLMRPKTA